jgi:hypothetical protein
MRSTQPKPAHGQNQDARQYPHPAGNRANTNGNKPTGHAAGAPAGSTIHFLKPLQAIWELKANYSTTQWQGGANHDYRGEYRTLLAHFKTPAQQLNAIEDLYAIVKAQPVYRNLKEPNWTEQTHPLDVLQWLLRKLSPLAKGADWTVDTIPGSDPQLPRYRFVILQRYHSQRVTYRIYNFPLEFLPKIHQADPHLHDLLVDTIAYLSKHAHIPFWDADGDYNRVIERLTPISQLEPGSRQHLLNSIYQKYPAAIYLQLLKQRRKLVTEKDIKQKMEAWQARPSERRRRVLDWCRQCLRTKGNLAEQTFIPNYMHLHPKIVGPQQHFKFIWSRHEHDAVNREVEKNWRNCKQYLPVAFSVALPGQILKPIAVSKYPEQLTELMKWTEAVFMRLHGQYFFGNQRLDKSISQILLEKQNAQAGIKPRVVDGKLLINIL